MYMAVTANISEYFHIPYHGFRQWSVHYVDSKKTSHFFLAEVPVKEGHWSTLCPSLLLPLFLLTAASHVTGQKLGHI